MHKRFGKRGKPKSDSRRPLIENNNNVLKEGCNQACRGFENPLAQNTFNTNKEQLSKIGGEITHQQLAELLHVPPDANTSVEGLIQRSVDEHFPKRPADLNKNLQQHLETVRNELLKLALPLESKGLTQCLIDCYHRKVFDHIHDLLQDISSPQSSFALMHWVMHAYLSEDLIDYPDLQRFDPKKQVDFLLFSELLIKAKDKLLENVQAEVRGYLVKILQNERSQKDKAYDELHVDTIMCINPMAEEARKISSDLSNRVQEVCFKELLLFLERYTAEQTERLSKEAKMEQPNMMHFFKTLNICKELRKYVQSKSEISLCKETTATLEKMEAFTLELLLEIVADVAERHLKNYFTTNNHRFLLLSTLKTLFPKAEICQEIQKRVMDEVYKLITHIYLKHLIQRSQRKLQKQWSHDVGKVVAEDAGLLDDIFKHLAPGVQQWNRMLLKVAELLECNDIEAVKLTVATMQNDCPTWSEDLNLLPALLRWKDLSGWQVREVLDAIPGNEPRSVSCFSCLKCW